MPNSPFLPKTLPIETLTEAGVFRIARNTFAAGEPSFRNAKTYRFDAPSGEFGTLYCAREFKTCFLEAVVRDQPSLNLSLADFKQRCALFLLIDTLKLKLVPVHGDAATNMRLDSAHLLGADYGYTQALSKAIHDHTDKPHGIVYRSRFDSSQMALVLFDRAKPFVRLFPNSKPVNFEDATELTDAVRSTVPFTLI